LPNTNKAFYRVVAVDAAGNQSGPSDYVEVPRPHVWNQPASTARVGQPYRFEPRVIRSIGDLRCRRSASSSYNAAFWDREEFQFTPVSLPPGLSQDPATGIVSGEPNTAGAFDLKFQVGDQGGNSGTVSYPLTVERR
jgi:hypothetical protein